jgi:uncharacterized protein YebE (UPF0316 family)
MEGFDLFAHVLLPLLIFAARVGDVTIGTLRIIFVSRGNKIVSPILGFFEVFIWIVAIGQIMDNLNNYLYYIAYASGFAAGNYAGLLVEEKLAIGKVLVRVVTSKPASELAAMLSLKKYGSTVVNAEGSQGPVQMLYTIVERKKIDEIAHIINSFNSKAFYTIEDLKKVSSGIFPLERQTGNLPIFKRWRRGK